MYLLNMEALEIGDIILTGNDEKLSRVIKKYTKGLFSHAILYVGHGSYIHSDRDGVHSGNIQRLIFENLDNVSVFRPRKKNVVKAACDFARSQVGKEYSVSSAINAKLKTPFPLGPNRQYCSKLVAQAYEYAGLKLVSDSNACTPQEIEKSEFLIVVSDVALEASEAEAAFATSESPIEVQTRITNEILEAARDVFHQDIQTLSELSSAIFESPEHDLKISKVISESGYLTLWDGDRIKNPWRYDYDVFSNLQIPIAEKLNLAKRERESSATMLDRFGSMLEMYSNAHQKFNLEYTKLHKELYLKLCKGMQVNQNVAVAIIDELT